MGEFGAISVISGNIIGRTQTLTLYVEGAYKVRGSEGGAGLHADLGAFRIGVVAASRQQHVRITAHYRSKVMTSRHAQQNCHRLGGSMPERKCKVRVMRLCRNCARSL